MNKKKKMIISWGLGMMLSVQALSGAALVSAAETAGEESVNIESTEQAVSLTFKELAGQEFWFSSGVGAWSTSLRIREDGSFSGTYSDSDAGDTGEGYPNGTRYLCEFEGQFTEPQKINDYTWSMQISSIQYKNTVGTEEIKEQIRYCYSEPYGLNDAQNILIYIPQAPLNQLPEEYLSWAHITDDSQTELSFYGLYNEAQQQGFVSCGVLDSINSMVASTEEQSATLKNAVQDGALSQSELNQKSAELYTLWDNLLNTIWAELKTSLSTEEMSVLTDEELDWISSKEAAVEAAGADFEGGTAQPMVENLQAASLTEDRVYELLTILKMAVA